MKNPYNEGRKDQGDIDKSEASTRFSLLLLSVVSMPGSASENHFAVETQIQIENELSCLDLCSVASEKQADLDRSDDGAMNEGEIKGDKQMLAVVCAWTSINTVVYNVPDLQACTTVL